MTKLYLRHAIGAIQPREDQLKTLEDMISRVQLGEFYIDTNEVVPSACIDGRLGGKPRPDAAGGTNSLVVAEDLLNDTDSDYLSVYREVVARLRKNDISVGGHDDEHVSDTKSGCGACDRLTDIYTFLAENPETIRSSAEELNIVVTDELHTLMIQNARQRMDFSDGKTIRNELDATNGSVLDHLRSSHNEVVVIINTIPGTTLDRDALAEAYGEAYEAFNVDVWSFANAADILQEIHSSTSTDDYIAAMVYYNLATAHVLCGPSMQVIVRS